MATTYYNNNYSYSYNNGNYSSQTTVVNGVAYTNNITTIGGSCSSDNTCQDGYSLYFPCVKNITRGQNVCFQFYVGDNAEQDELDLRDLDALSLTLSGQFGCTYNTYTYPDDIISLQSENYKEIFSDDFNEYPTNVCNFKIKYFDEDFQTVKPNITGYVGKFYYGTEIKLKAEDTPTHIFLGWGKPNKLSEDENCEIVAEDEDDVYYGNARDYIFTENKEYTFSIKSDTILYAIYRPREEYEVRVSYDNRHSHFIVYYNDKRYYLSDKERDVVKVLEGYQFNVVCVPNKSYLSDGGFSYIFKKWSDGYEYQARIMTANDNISLLAECYDSASNTSNIDNSISDNTNEIEIVENNFSYKDPVEYNLFDDMEYHSYTANDDIVEIDNCYMAYKDGNGFLYLNNGYFKTNLLDVTDGVKIKIKVFTDNGGSITLSLGDDVVEYQPEENGQVYEYEYLFRHCDNSYIKVSSAGKIYIDEMYIYEEVVENQGKMQLCLTPEDTAKMHTGPLYASGAISVNGNVFGISQTLIGNINNLTKINVI